MSPPARSRRRPPRRCARAWLRHGIKANRLILDTAGAYSLEQGLTPRLMRLTSCSPRARWISRAADEARMCEE